MSGQPLWKTSTIINHTKYPLISVVWEDSFGVTNSWEHIEDLDPLPQATCYSVGYLMEETDDYITIVQSVSKEQILGRLTIPQGAITSSVVVAPGKEDL